MLVGGERQTRVRGRFFSRGLSHQRICGQANELTRAVVKVQGSSVQGRRRDRVRGAESAVVAIVA